MTVLLAFPTPHPDLPSSCASAYFVALSVGFPFLSSSFSPSEPWFPGSFSLEPPFVAAFLSVSVLAAPLLFPIPLSWHAQLFHSGFRVKKIKITPSCTLQR